MAAETQELIAQPQAPIERAPLCTRELFLRPPDWRYREATEYLRDQRQKKVPSIPTDPFVQYAIRLLRADHDPGASIYLNTMWKEAASVVFLGTVLKRSAIVAEIEANIIQGTTAEQLAMEGFYVPPAVYALYEKIFFDLSGITAIHAWMNDFIFEPERHVKNGSLLRSRLLAYYAGPARVAEVSVTGHPMEPSTRELLETISASERQKKVFDYLTKEAHIDATTYATLMETAIKSMTERDFQERMKAREEVGSSSLEELAQNLEQGVRLFSTEEQDRADKSGLDSNNQYVAVILRKDTNNGKQNSTDGGAEADSGD